MEINNISIIGAGLMGHGIAQVCATHGYNVKLTDIDAAYLKKAIEKIDTSLKRFVKKKTLSDVDRKKILDRIQLVPEFEDTVADANLVIEAVSEDINLKKSIFKALDEHTNSSAILASNTSQFSITEIASAVSDPARVVGMHWFNPPVLMKLIEVVKGLLTSDGVINCIREFAGRVNKEVVVCNDSQGFITTRALMALRLECYRILEEGVASRKDIDKALKLALGHPMGQFELADFSGLNLEVPVCESLTASFGERFRAPQILLNNVRAGRLGRKSGAGWYDYSEKG